MKLVNKNKNPKNIPSETIDEPIDEPIESQDEVDEGAMEQEYEEAEKQTKQKLKARVKKKPIERFSVFRNPERMGIIDTETNEVIAEGEFAILQSNANIMERCERIENLLGSLMED